MNDLVASPPVQRSFMLLRERARVRSGVTIAMRVRVRARSSNHRGVAVLAATSLNARTHERWLLLQGLLFREIGVEAGLTIQGSFAVDAVAFAVAIPQSFLLLFRELVPKLLNERLDDQTANVHLDHLKDKDAISAESAEIFFGEHADIGLIGSFEVEGLDEISLHEPFSSMGRVAPDPGDQGEE